MYRVLTVFNKIPQYVGFSVQELRALLVEAFGETADWARLFADEINTTEHLTTWKAGPHAKRFGDWLPVTEAKIPRYPYMCLRLTEDEIPLLAKVVERSVLVDAFLLLFGEANTYEDLFTSVNLPLLERYSMTGQDFSFRIHSHQKSRSRKEQIEIIDNFERLPFNGKVNIEDPRQIYWVAEDWDTDHKKNWSLRKVYFGLELATRARGVDARFNYRYRLSDRVYLAPTTLDNDLAFLMANQARVRPDSVVFDPFVGSGSILVACSHFGATCYGCDIDARVLHGLGVGRPNKASSAYREDLKYSVWTNFEQYGFQRPEIVRLDSSETKLHISQLFDAIVCDPPYGIRAAARKSGKSPKKKARKEEKALEAAAAKLLEVKEEEVKEEKEEQEVKDEEEEKEDVVEEETKDQYIIPTQLASCDFVVERLFHFARTALRPGGRMVFLFPWERERGMNYEELPHDEDFRLLECSENILNKNLSRVCLTYERL
eukprot:TRINITY_DN4449_c0_g1_i1.p1 TRINITY_DN4449_c0_g1~~TRINITY_DN4449_c0_g1_i1.p1  ORF type:complete len:488 (+),score=141.21 TRINITY_DN4449_c0_g1_i1:1379-2842(+)